MIFAENISKNDKKITNCLVDSKKSVTFASELIKIQHELVTILQE